MKLNNKSRCTRSGLQTSLAMLWSTTGELYFFNPLLTQVRQLALRITGCMWNEWRNSYCVVKKTALSWSVFPEANVDSKLSARAIDSWLSAKSSLVFAYGRNFSNNDARQVTLYLAIPAVASLEYTPTSIILAMSSRLSNLFGQFNGKVLPDCPVLLVFEGISREQ